MWSIKETRPHTAAGLGKKTTFSLEVERGKLLDVESRKYKASLWSACMMEHEAITDTLIQIRQQFDAAKHMRERGSREHKQSRLSVSEGCQQHQHATSTTPNLGIPFMDADNNDDLPAKRNSETHSTSDTVSQKEDESISTISELEKIVFDYLDANRGLASQRRRYSIFIFRLLHLHASIRPTQIGFRCSKPAAPRRMPFLPPQQYPDPRVAHEVEELHARYLKRNQHDVRSAIQSLQVALSREREERATRVRH
jgi:hypothetical protein